MGRVAYSDISEPLELVCGQLIPSLIPGPEVRRALWRFLPADQEHDDKDDEAEHGRPANGAQDGSEPGLCVLTVRHVLTERTRPPRRATATRQILPPSVYTRPHELIFLLGFPVPMEVFSTKL